MCRGMPLRLQWLTTMPVEIPDDRPRLTIRLRDGSEALLSPLTAEDSDLVEEGLDHLSVESRYTRFGRGLSHLSHSELEYLTNVDQRNHVAWGAVVDGEVAGVGRYIRIPEIGCAEIAVTVIDEFQYRGLGTLLFEALTAIARSDGVEAFCFVVVPDNRPVRRILERLDVQLTESVSLLEGKLAVADLPTGVHDVEMISVMNQVRG
ncbi:MAG: GNAT family N-acetyltransferase [Acidobacteria bacterium]|nr:MAG: GNAT family N-acetyltransferase [Acidobacteriota bacterium]